jgi:hypothetical protein
MQSFYAHQTIDLMKKYPLDDFSCKFYYENDIEVLSNIIDELEKFGYFVGMTSKVIGMCKEKMLTLRSPIEDFSLNNDNQLIRSIWLDAETIFEEGCCRYIQKFFTMPLFMEHPILQIRSWTDKHLYYYISIENTNYCLWKYNTSIHTSQDWYDVFLKTITLMNTILEKLSPENQVYFEYEGNDSTVVILTQEMACFLKEKNIIATRTI